ncbi:hypothetical protein OsJ_14809 [Oryza sativa Japonica Group]|uniref:Uncharacterized protein n=1 Tax=Oryza sativa subsp. japonica TaxID=39947 RepID=B9FF64_ORYSJ|nr:hypothetical protein OsJ_14809 [Oryza sativa Japonica Group]
MHLVTSYDAVADAGKNRLYLLLPQFERSPSPSPSPEPPRRRPPWPGAPERGVDMAPYPYVEKVERVKAGTRLYLLLPDPFDQRSPEPGRAAVGMPYLEKVEKVYPKEEEEKPAARGGRGRSYGGAGDDNDDDEKDKYYRNRLTERWSWRTSTSPPPFSGGRRITGHALHPDGRTIFVSVEKTHARRHPGDEDDEEDGTFSYDTERGGKWTRRGGWRLPFKGQAHYDRHLNAWGLEAARGPGGGSRVEIQEQHISSRCRSPSRPRSPTISIQLQPPPVSIPSSAAAGLHPALAAATALLPALHPSQSPALAISPSSLRIHRLRERARSRATARTPRSKSDS